ncbi:MAG: DUF1700 domain-containing protein [Bacilli bacterium]|nr:DUF1700 domain-containing protein [Bacilli bacterium]
MKKNEFLDKLRKNLNGLPKQDVDERIEFYSEMIDDRVEEGKTEEEAIREIGDVDEITSQILAQTPFTKIVKEKIKNNKRHVSALEVVLLILGFPLWFPLLLTGLVLIFVAYILLCVGVIVMYSIEFSVIVSGIASLILFFASMSVGFDFFYLACAFLGIGFAIVLYNVCVLVTKATIKLTKKILLGIKKKIVGGKDNA